ncbi:hypothetical protein W97_03598 [Coniosporium apollinis CBS 100218]|uniref:Nickel/cobalt efflux system n=1 Tax=Coniosporium apollinis (strain CBS 100218) TaxID=1168221 RepID=R7YR23_CONA1|nr:uncharacterized protein W97_03598 [Coniosporium apollinis CBS 100218]EON64367.1 hypothetical protein W97_03598 [Coniosporium apollinis CBS 100218]
MDSSTPTPYAAGISDEERSFLKKATDRAVVYHGRVPYLSKLPFRAVAIIVALVVVNLVVWAATGVVLATLPSRPLRALISTAVLSWTLGLRHALDADHISAIDLMTRRLIAAGQRPVTVGMFFSLGHSTIVIITSLIVAATASAVSSRFDSFSRVGGIIGTSVSAAFLLLLGVMNMWILYKLVQQMRKHIDARPGEEERLQIHGAGCLFQLFKRMFKLIDRPWKMYPLGVLFGLGFDTSSEIAILGISSIQAARGTSIWLILIFPLLFTAGMCMLDTTDGALMMSLYTSTALARDQIAILYYSIVLTIVTVVVAVVIGIIQLLNLVFNVAEPKGRFWDGVEKAGEHYDIIGGAICASFVVFGALSVLVYKPWRRCVDRKRQQRAILAEDEDAELSNTGLEPLEGPDGGAGSSTNRRHGDVEIIDVDEDESLREPQRLQSSDGRKEQRNVAVEDVLGKGPSNRR